MSGCIESRSLFQDERQGERQVGHIIMYDLILMESIDTADGRGARAGRVSASGPSTSREESSSATGGRSGRGSVVLVATLVLLVLGLLALLRRHARVTEKGGEAAAVVSRRPLGRRGGPKMTDGLPEAAPPYEGGGGWTP